MKRYFTTTKSGEEVEVDQELARQLVASGKKRYEDFSIEEDSSAAPAPAAAPQRAATPWWKQKPTDGPDKWTAALFPRSYADTSGAPDAWTRLKDGLSLPGRAAAGLAAGAGDLVGNIASEAAGRRDPMASGTSDLSSALAALREEMGAQGGSGSGVQRLAGDLMKDPMLPLLGAILPATGGAGMAGAVSKSLPAASRWTPLARAAVMGAESAPVVLGTQALDRAGTGQGIGAKDAAIAMGLGMLPGLADYLPMGGQYLRSKANERFTAGIKPRQRTGREAEGLQQFLAAGNLPKVAGFTDLQWNRPAEKFSGMMDQVAGPEYDRVLAAADATAAAAGTPRPVPKGAMAKGAEEGILGFAQRNPGAFTAADMAAARQDVFDRLSMAGADAATAREIAFGGGQAAVPTHLTPSEAQRLKSGLAADAFKRKDMTKAVEAGEQGAADAARSHLGALFPEIADLNSKWAPWYAARGAMETAAQRGANRGLWTNIKGFPESPGFARGLYGLGSVLQDNTAPITRFSPIWMPTAQQVTNP